MREDRNDKMAESSSSQMANIRRIMRENPPRPVDDPHGFYSQSALEDEQSVHVQLQLTRQKSNQSQSQTSCIIQVVMLTLLVLVCTMMGAPIDGPIGTEGC